MVKKKKTAATWLSRTKIYGFELFMAAFGLTVAAAVTDYGLFAFFNYLIDDQGAGSYIGDASLVIVAAMVIWLPLAILFYLRARGEQARDKARSRSGLHKVLISVLLFVNILIAAGAAFAVVYSLFQMAIGADMPAGELLVRVTIPAVLMTLLHVWVCFAFSDVKFAGRRAFAWSFLAAGTVVMVALSFASFGTVRAAAMDERASSDLETISGKVRAEYRDTRTLPDSLGDIEFDGELRDDVDEYYYKPMTLGRYELCADFATDTTQEYGDYDDREEYSSYDSFYSHSKGRDCFKLRAGYSNYPYDELNRLD